jgi:hypothetical protein
MKVKDMVFGAKVAVHTIAHEAERNSMKTITVTYSKILPVWTDGPEQLCEISTTYFAYGPAPSVIAEHLNSIRG